MRRASLLVVIAVLSACATSRAAGPIWVTKLCRVVPRTEEAMAAAHEANRAGCLQVPVGDPLESTGFAERTVYDVTTSASGVKTTHKLAYDFSRLNALSIALRLAPEDEANLPLLSKRRIMARLASNYLVIQARVHRAENGGAPYLYFKPFACVESYGQELTQEFHALMEDSVREVHSLGLFLSKGTAPSAENLRTLVAVNREDMLLSNEDGTTTVRPHYELLLVRLRMDGDRPVLHTFVTDEYGTRLRYLRPSIPAKAPEDCALIHTIFFTEYTTAKQSPSAKATRHIEIHSLGAYPFEKLDEYATSQGWAGTATDHLSETLDAIIDGKIPPVAIDDPASAAAEAGKQAPAATGPAASSTSQPESAQGNSAGGEASSGSENPASEPAPASGTP